MILKAHTCRMKRRHFLCRVHNPGAAKEERLQRSDSDDVRKGSSGADGFVIAVFSGLLNASHCQRNEGAKDRSEHRKLPELLSGRQTWGVQDSPLKLPELLSGRQTWGVQDSPLKLA